MKNRARFLLPLAALAGFALPAFSQGGSLTPPAGPPGATMKPLNLVEPRIPLVSGAPGVTVESSGRIIINQPGSYYLTKNVTIATPTTGILIFANGVTLDLMGFSVIYNGIGSAQSGIDVAGSNITVENGHILSTTTSDGSSFIPGGFGYGVVGGSSQNNVTIRNLSVTGPEFSGIHLDGAACRVEGCSVRISGGTGISAGKAVVKDSIVDTTGTMGIAAQSVLDCRVSNAGSYGIQGEVVANGWASCRTPSGTGINARIVTGSVGIADHGMGIYAETVSTSKGESNGESALGSCGIKAVVVSDSTGLVTKAGGGHGIDAERCVTGSYGSTEATGTGMHAIYCAVGKVSSSYGNSAGGCGIYAETVDTSEGVSRGTDGSSHGIYASNGVSGSTGRASAVGGGCGIFGTRVGNCYGYAGTGAQHGIWATLVSHSTGSRASDETSSSKYGIQATRAVGCYSSFGESISQKFDMP